MALCCMHWLMPMTRCNNLAFINVSFVSVNRTLSPHCKHFSTSAKLGLPVGMNNCVSARKNLFRPFSDVFQCEHLFAYFKCSSVASWTRTMQSSAYLYPDANWVTKSRLLSSFRHSSDVSLQRTLNKFSATSKNVHDSQTVGLNQCTTTKHLQKWSIFGVVRQLVCAVFVLVSIYLYLSNSSCTQMDFSLICFIFYLTC